MAALQTKSRSWFELEEAPSIPSPALLVYRERVERNLMEMQAIAGNPQRLRPHIKTHKIREMIEWQLALGITKFKCATIAEAELAASAKVPDLLLAYQPTGPARERLRDLVRAFPETKFSTICDDAKAIRELSKSFEDGESAGLEVLIDLDIGQQRTGVPPDDTAVELYRLIASARGLAPGGFHAYDGHITEGDPSTRAKACDAAFAPVRLLREKLESIGLRVPRIVAGGTPTFRIHAQRGEVECSPGTCVFWDAGYAARFPDLEFVPAAIVLTRVISKPAINRLCLDLGHKAIASEMPSPRVQFLNVEGAKAVMHSEEHLVIETNGPTELSVGDWLYGVPWHICPTVALHSCAFVIEKQKVIGTWQIAARDRRITF